MPKKKRAKKSVNPEQQIRAEINETQKLLEKAKQDGVLFFRAKRDKADGTTIFQSVINYSKKIIDLYQRVDKNNFSAKDWTELTHAYEDQAHGLDFFIKRGARPEVHAQYTDCLTNGIDLFDKFEFSSPDQIRCFASLCGSFGEDLFHHGDMETAKGRLLHSQEHFSTLPNIGGVISKPMQRNQQLLAQIKRDECAKDRQEIKERKKERQEAKKNDPLLLAQKEFQQTKNTAIGQKKRIMQLIMRLPLDDPDRISFFQQLKLIAADLDQYQNHANLSLTEINSVITSINTLNVQLTSLDTTINPLVQAAEARRQQLLDEKEQEQREQQRQHLAQQEEKRVIFQQQLSTCDKLIDSIRSLLESVRDHNTNSNLKVWYGDEKTSSYRTQLENDTKMVVHINELGYSEENAKLLKIVLSSLQEQEKKARQLQSEMKGEQKIKNTNSKYIVKKGKSLSVARQLSKNFSKWSTVTQTNTSTCPFATYVTVRWNNKNQPIAFRPFSLMKPITTSPNKDDSVQTLNSSSTEVSQQEEDMEKYLKNSLDL